MSNVTWWYLVTSFATVALGLVAKLIFLGGGLDYPRTVQWSRTEDAVGIFVNFLILLWGAFAIGWL